MLKFEDLQSSKNIADLLDEEELSVIAHKVIEGHELDEESRLEWKDTTHKAMELAKQVMSKKNTPWPNSSNVKYPLITNAAIDYASRTLPAIIQNDRIVQVSVIGQDADQQKYQRGSRVGRFMSYQLLQASDSWEDNMDKLLHILPILGTAFKKTYYEPIKGRPVSEVCSPDKIVVNYGIDSLESARRVGHIIHMYANDIIERIRSGIYSDVDADELKKHEGYEDDDDAPIELIEQHNYLDLDGDGYSEPYIVVVHPASGKILRIVNRFNKVEKNSKGEIKRIDPIQYFTDFHYIKSPDGGFYSIGLGSLLLPINESINTLINQLIDSGTLNNSQGGFIGRGLRLKNGEFKIRLGEWKVLDAATGTNIAQNIVPLPTKEPSPTLFQLLGMLIEAGRDLASANDVMQGKQPAQNVPATTILTLVEQGMKVFNAIHKRLYRSLKKEFYKIYLLNGKYLKDKDYAAMLDEPGSVKDDFKVEGVDILPVADPIMSSDAQRLAKAQVVMGVPGINPYEAAKYYLEAVQLDKGTIERLLPPPDPNAPPPPDVMKTAAEAAKLDAETKVALTEVQINSEKQLLEAARLNIQRDEAMARVREAEARISKMEEDAAVNRAKVELAELKAGHEADMKELDFVHKREKDQVDLTIDTLDTVGKLAKEAKDDDDKSE